MQGRDLGIGKEREWWGCWEPAPEKFEGVEESEKVN
jgi:hypothetical protein